MVETKDGWVLWYFYSALIVEFRPLSAIHKYFDCVSAVILIADILPFSILVQMRDLQNTLCQIQLRSRLLTSFVAFQYGIEFCGDTI
jgi:hypothetical protein